jgi:hypothetical protein
VAGWRVVILEKVRDTQPALLASTEKRFRDQMSRAGRTIHCDQPTSVVKNQRTRDFSGVRSLAAL